VREERWFNVFIHIISHLSQSTILPTHQPSYQPTTSNQHLHQTNHLIKSNHQPTKPNHQQPTHQPSHQPNHLQIISNQPSSQPVK